MPLPYQVESFGITDLGLARANNEDVFQQIPMQRFFLLADGMGGHNAGEIAAKEVIHHLSSAVYHLPLNNPETSVEFLLSQAIQNANLWVHKLSEQKQELSGMGTTLCCCLFHEHSLIYANVGDSRIYRFRRQLLQLTQDHSSIKKNMITKAIGTSPIVEPDIKTDTVELGDIYFLCSDGLTDFVPDEELSSILCSSHCIKNASRKMIDAAKNKGGSDNITILMLKIVS